MNRGVRMRKYPRTLTNPHITYYNKELCNAWSHGLRYPASEKRAINSLRYAILINYLDATAEIERQAAFDVISLIPSCVIAFRFLSWLKRSHQ